MKKNIVIAVLAIFVAVGVGMPVADAGSKWLGKNDVKSKHIKNGAVKSKDIRNGNVKMKDLRKGVRRKINSQPRVLSRAQGHVILTEHRTVSSALVARRATVHCPSDKAPTGGGVSINQRGYAESRVLGSHPANESPGKSNFDGWTAVVATDSDDDVEFTVWVVCVSR